ncbi:MAG: peptidylprolyl isomerase fpr4 [Bathelium mastoideum]|nr:MAG: peptidylprolyl isomerase fpr4 [Bathelium mastoideum]
MAAIDPSAPPQQSADVSVEAPRATLKIIREPLGVEDDDEDDDDDFDIDQMRALLGEEEDDDDDEEDENGEGPSDPSKTNKARAEALKKELEKDEDDDLADAIPNGINGVASSKKGKAKASDDDDDDEDMEDDEDDEDMEEFVICTLDPHKNYQQPLDITVGKEERVYFSVSGNYNIYLTGNYVVSPRELAGSEDSDEEDEDYDLSIDQDDLEDGDIEEDELDDMEDPRITELDDEEAPKLVKAVEKKGKNKRAAESEDEDEDDVEEIKKLVQQEQALNGEQKLSKKQAKKLKNNKGEAIVAVKAENIKEEPQTKEGANKNEKKVQFAKNLEQGPSNSLKNEGKQENKNGEKPKAALGVKIVQGVKMDDKKLGVGPATKKGDRVDMRYIGKLEKDGKVFDSNKKGKPFSFRLGNSEVIKGWDIGVVGMSVGGERRISVPANLAYGSKGVPGIPPNSPLVFDVKLLAIK